MNIYMLLLSAWVFDQIQKAHQEGVELFELNWDELKRAQKAQIQERKWTNLKQRSRATGPSIV